MAPGPLVAVSGLGSIGLQHLRAVLTIPGARAVAFDPAATLASRAPDLAGLVAQASDFTALLDAGPTAVIIAGPDQVHLGQLRAVAERGIPVLVEKPLAVHHAEAAAVVPHVERTGTPVLTGYVLRHRESVRLARELIADGVIGTPAGCQVMLGSHTTVTVAASRFDTVEPDRLYRDYSHEWDYLRWFFGPVAQATAVARTVRGAGHAEVPNSVDALLEHDSGLISAVHLDYLEPAGTRTVHVTGTGGWLRMDVPRGTVTVRRGGTDHELRYERPEPAAACLRRQAVHLLDVARGAAAPEVTLADGLAALAITGCVRDAARARAWLPVPACPAPQPQPQPQPQPHDHGPSGADSAPSGP